MKIGGVVYWVRIGGGGGVKVRGGGRLSVGEGGVLLQWARIGGIRESRVQGWGAMGEDRRWWGRLRVGDVVIENTYEESWCWGRGLGEDGW